METLRIGSQGSTVRTLQEKLGLSADGIFGRITEAKVKAFQEQHGLTPDGVVGPMTWEALGVSSSVNQNSKCVDSSVRYLPLSVHVTRKPGRKIEYLCIHYTAGGSSAPGKAAAVKNVFEKRKASADFCVDDRDICQFNPDLNNRYCWSVGDNLNKYSSGGKLKGVCLNGNSISVEICSNLKKGYNASDANHAGWYFTEAALDNAVKLAKILMQKFNIPLSRVVRHYDVTGKLCPGIIGWNDEAIYENGKRTKQNSDSSAWEAFKERLK